MEPANPIGAAVHLLFGRWMGLREFGVWGESVGAQEDSFNRLVEYVRGGCAEELRLAASRYVELTGVDPELCGRAIANIIDAARR